jgi:uncharacterized protein (TIGR00730 family)
MSTADEIPKPATPATPAASAPPPRDLTAEERARLLEAILASPSYKIAFEDVEFLYDDELRPVRLQLELLKPEKYLRAHEIRSTIVVFGSARLLPAGEARRQLDELQARLAASGETPELAAALARARKQVEHARYYEEARRFAQLLSQRFQAAHRRDFVVVTGGGPGIMEAANRGAFDVGARSIGLNITLPHEQAPNPYITPELCFRFHYFALRKMHFLMRAKGLVAFPGGYGTFDELFEALTLIQTRTIAPMPVVLVGRGYWSRVVDFQHLVDEGMIAPADAGLFEMVETAEEIVAAIDRFYGGATPR